MTAEDGGRLGGSPPGAGLRALQRAVDVRPREVAMLLLSAAYFFCILSAYFIIRPIRDEMGVAGGVNNLALLWSSTLAGTLLIHPLFAALVAKLSRWRFVALTYRFFIANLLIFFVLLRVIPEDENIWLGRVFYVWASVFNLFIISLFWSFMVDVFRTEQGKRLFGFIAVGGTLGAVVGATLTTLLVQKVGAAVLLVASAALLELAVLCVRLLSRRATELTVVNPSRGTPERPIGGGVLAGFTHVARSPYLVGIASYIVILSFAGTVLYFQQAHIADAYFQDRATRVGFFARIDLAVQLLTLLTQAFLTGRIIKLLGVGITLTLLPAVSLVGFTALGVMPTVAVFVVFQVLRTATQHALARPARETLFTVVSREDKYKAKNLIDTFVLRGADQVSAWSYGGLLALGMTVGGIALVAAPVAAIWLAIALWLGKEQSEMLRGPTRGTVAGPAEPAVP